MLLDCSYRANSSSSISLSDVSSIAQAVIALVNLVFVWYLFIYQKRKDKQDSVAQIEIQEQSIKLQWFKDLIIQPHLSDIYKFYKDLYKIEDKLCSTYITDEKRIEVTNEIKEKQSDLRRTFVDSIKDIDSILYVSIKSNLDSLTDMLTENIFNSALDFTDKSVYDNEIRNLIIYSRNDLISKIFNYKGAES